MAGGMKDLLGDTLFYPAAPGFKEHTTSREAAERVTSTAETLRGLALQHLRAIYPCGATADELAEQFNVSVLSMRPRISELRRKGEIVPSGERHTNSSGMSAHVWRARK